MGRQQLMAVLWVLVLLGPHVLVASSPDGCVSDGTVTSAQKISNSYGDLSPFYTLGSSDYFGRVYPLPDLRRTDEIRTEDQ